MTIKERLNVAQAAIVRGDWARATFQLEKIKRATRSQRLKRVYADAARMAANRVRVA